MKSSSASAGREGGTDKSHRPGWLKESMTLCGGSTDGKGDTGDDEEGKERGWEDGEDGGKRKTDVMGDGRCVLTEQDRALAR